MTRRLRSITIILTVTFVSSLSAQEQASVAVYPLGALSNGDRWVATGLSRDLIEKLVRTPELRPVDPHRVSARLDAIMTEDEEMSAWLPLSAQRKVGQWLDADIIVIGVVGSSGNRSEARAFLDGLSVVPTVTPDGSEVWIAAKLIDIHRGMPVSWAFAEGSRDGYFELQDALYLQMIADLGIDPGGMAEGTIGRPTESIKAYRLTLEAEDLLLDAVGAKKPAKKWRQASRRIEQSLKLDPTYAKSYLLAGEIAEKDGDMEGAFAAYGQASALDPNYVSPRLAIANAANLAGDSASEIAALQSVLEAANWHDLAYDLIGQAYERMGEIEAAAENYDRSIRLSSADPERLYRGGSAHLNLGQFERAIPYLERAAARIPGRTAYHVRLIRAYTWNGDHRRAQTALDLAASIGAESTDLWLAAGELALEKKDFDAAEKAFVRVLAEQPDRMDAQLMVARLRAVRGDYQAAVDAYMVAIANGLPVRDVVEPLAAAYIGLGQRDLAEQLYRDALTKHPGEVSWMLAQSRILIEALRYGEAIPVLRRVLDIDADHVDATEWIASAYAAVGNDAEAIRKYKRLLRIAPDRTHAYVRLGDLSYRVREFEAARNAYGTAIAGGLGTADVYAGLGLSEEELSRYRSARTAYRKALDRDRDNEIARAGLRRMASKIKAPRREPTAADWAARARSLSAAGDLEGAVGAFKRSIARDGSNPAVHSELGSAYARLGDTAAARSAFETAERLDPTPESAYNLGRLCYQEGKTSEATLNYQIALQRDETFLRAAMNIAALQTGGDDPLAAIKTLQDARRHHPSNGAVSISLANAYFQAGDLDRAAKVYAEARVITGTQAEAEIGLGNVALTLGDTTAAADHYQSAIAAAPQNPDPLVNLGTVQIQQGRYEEAVESFRKALDLNPSDLALYLNLSVLYYHTGQYAEALEYCRAILEQDTSMIAAQRLIGDIAMATSEHELAIDAYQSVLRLDTGDLQSILGVAEALSMLERPEEAREYWQQWLDIAGDDPAYASQAQAITRRLEGTEGESGWFYEQLKELRSFL